MNSKEIKELCKQIKASSTPVEEESAWERIKKVGRWARSKVRRSTDTHGAVPEGRKVAERDKKKP
jgi:hypothetical protein